MGVGALKKKERKNKEETLQSSRQKWGNNEVDVRLFCNIKCQKTRAHYQHYVKKSFLALFDITHQPVFHIGRREKGICWHAESESMLFLYLFRKSLKTSGYESAAVGKRIIKYRISITIVTFTESLIKMVLR